MEIDKRQIAYNRTSRSQKPKYIVVHDTGNVSRGADALANFKYFNGGNRDSSADFFVDDSRVLRANDYTKYYTWHCGDGKGKYGITNANSVGVEICVNADGDYDRAVANTVELVRYLMAELGIPQDRVVRHYDASRKCCPSSMSGDNWAKWVKFKKSLESEVLTVGQYEELKKEIEALKNPMIYNYIDENMPEWARAAVAAAVACGAIEGDGGGLALTYADLRAIVREYRAGLYR